MSGFFKSLWLCSIALVAAIDAGGSAALADPAGLAEPTSAVKSTVSPLDAPASPDGAAGPIDGDAAGARVNPDADAPSAAPQSPAPEISPPLPPDDRDTPPIVMASKLPAAVEAALAALVAEDVKTSPIGAGDWRAAREAIWTFYAARDFAPVWVDEQGLTPAANSALARLAQADADGLDLSVFALPKGPFEDASPERLAEAEAVISAAVVAYAMQASGARLVPTRISPLVAARPNVANPGPALAAVAAAVDPGAALEDFNPQQKGYVDLRDQLTRLRASAPIAAPRIPTGPTLGIGMTDPRVALVRARLGLDWTRIRRTRSSMTRASPRRWRRSSARTAWRRTAPSRRPQPRPCRAARPRLGRR